MLNSNNYLINTIYSINLLSDNKASYVQYAEI